MEWGAKQAARARGFDDHSLIFKRWQRQVGCVIWQRLAAVVKACLPKCPGEAMLLLDGFKENEEEFD